MFIVIPHMGTWEVETLTVENNYQLIHEATN